MGHHYELPIMSFVAVILVLLPLPWHWKARNVATLSLIAWLAVSNTIRGINAIIWMDNVVIHYRVWCDIVTKIMIGVSVALPACSFCITRYLEHVASARYAVSTAADKRRRQIIDLCITFGIPILVMALHYIVQGHRFDILEDLGCQASTYSSIAGILIVYATPLALSAGSLVFATLALRHFAIRRLEFEQHLKDSRSALTTARYMRLMALALCEMLWGTSLGSFIIFDNIRRLGLRPWISWNNVHYNFSRIAIYPTFLMPDWPRVLLAWWILPCTSILFFGFFGFSDEAREGYASMYRWVRRNVFRRPDTTVNGSNFSKNGTLPRFQPTKTPTRLRSFSHPDDDIDLDFPELKDMGSSIPYLPPAYVGTKLIKDDLETSSALSLTFPNLDADATLGGDAQNDDKSSDVPPTPSTLAPDSSAPGEQHGIRVATQEERF